MSVLKLGYIIVSVDTPKEVLDAIMASFEVNGKIGNNLIVTKKLGREITVRKKFCNEL